MSRYKIIAERVGSSRFEDLEKSDVNCLGVKPRGFFLRFSVTLPCHSRSGDLQ